MAGMSKKSETSRTDSDIEQLRTQLDELRLEVEKHRQAAAAAPGRGRSRRDRAAHALSAREGLWYLGRFMLAGTGVATALVLALGLIEKI